MMRTTDAAATVMRLAVRLLPRVPVLASDCWVHVRKRAARVRFPGPDVQFVERRQAVTIRRAREIEELSFQRSRTLGGDIFNRNQFHFAVRFRLIHDRLRLLDVDALADQRSLDVVNAHGAAVGTARAWYRRIAFRDRDRDVLEAVIGGAHMGGERIAFRDGGPSGTQRQQTNGTGPIDNAQFCSPKFFHPEKNPFGKGTSFSMQAVASLEPRGSLRFVSLAGYTKGAARKSLVPALFLR